MKKFVVLLFALTVYHHLLVAAENISGDTLFKVNTQQIENEFISLDNFTQSFIQTSYFNQLSEAGCLEKSRLGINKQIYNNGTVFTIHSLFLGPFGVATESMKSNKWQEQSEVAAILISVVVVAVVMVVLIYSVENPNSELAQSCGNAIGEIMVDACVSSCSNSDCSGSIFSLF